MAYKILGLNKQTEFELDFRRQLKTFQLNQSCSLFLASGEK